MRAIRRCATVLTLMIAVALTPTGVAGADDERPVTDAEYFSVVALVQDEQGVEVPIRSGDATFGHAKACWKHNFCSLRALSLAISGSGNKQTPEGRRVVYRAHLVGGGIDIVLRVVADTSPFTARGIPLDGRTAGVITAYCEGMARCPDALNAA